MWSVCRCCGLSDVPLGASAVSRACFYNHLYFSLYRIYLSVACWAQSAHRPSLQKLSKLDLVCRLGVASGSAPFVHRLSICRSNEVIAHYANWTHSSLTAFANCTNIWHENSRVFICLANDARIHVDSRCERRNGLCRAASPLYV